ncbi:Asp23/Gls24 family envelope stress response protein [Streptomyces sp. NBC_01221]|nr:Asp23/Gls24 family envelope stress response protein [Streptomyces sp. NBC_01221]MCX4793912.1 Asp23/Gls24 family envelope stress response protein [Streptomyces sp. NBC_01242]WSJ35328.1 Asp23/Gls24 family envelope stress response protein [Streptomyces sp. NBC_01321]WSP58587.1 Asp23/Gls24 family envelope stress response protein [Streptomyces sp. NBC_01241]WSP61760.1 Asp23/Gls24 family envelope stress response protein [Streptomyces sp. NBC_01240]WSU20835.1 Asp23/Gls24 family envelope stress res
MTSDVDRRPGLPRGERGATTVSDRVVAKIASHVAREALSRFTESASHVPPDRRTPHVTTSVRRAPERNDTGRDSDPADSRPAMLGEVRMRIAMELGYPSDIGTQCAAVRREVIERLRTWAGMDVSGLTVSVERLHSVHSRHTDRERVR